MINHQTRCFTSQETMKAEGMHHAVGHRSGPEISGLRVLEREADQSGQIRQAGPGPGSRRFCCSRLIDR